MVKSIQNAAHYNWGNNCDGWHLLNTAGLSVIQERMPAGTAEKLHFHTKAQQLFYILSGVAIFEAGESKFTVQTGESLHVLKGTKHRIINGSDSELMFLVISEPKSHGDRTDL